jgi:hypothetical protein
MTSPLRTADYGTEYDETAGAEAADEAPARRQPGQLVELMVEGQEPFTVRVLNFAMTFVCWSAAKRAGLTALGFDAFAEVLEDYDVVAEAPADPTR